MCKKSWERKKERNPHAIKCTRRRRKKEGGSIFLRTYDSFFPHQDIPYYDCGGSLFCFLIWRHTAAKRPQKSICLPKCARRRWPFFIRFPSLWERTCEIGITLFLILKNPRPIDRRRRSRKLCPPHPACLVVFNEVRGGEEPKPPLYILSKGEPVVVPETKGKGRKQKVESGEKRGNNKKKRGNNTKERPFLLLLFFSCIWRSGD